MAAGLYYKGVLFYTLFIINKLLLLLRCKECHVIVKRLCSFNKYKIKSVKKVRPSGLHENMLLLAFQCPENLLSCKLTIKYFLTTAKLLTQPSDKSDIVCQ